MEAGTIVEYGTHAELVRGGAYARLVRAQLLPIRKRPSASSREVGLLALEHLVHDAIGPSLRVERALHVGWIVDRLDPLEERHRRLRVIGKITIEEMVEDACIGLAKYVRSVAESWRLASPMGTPWRICR